MTAHTVVAVRATAIHNDNEVCGIIWLANEMIHHTGFCKTYGWIPANIKQIYAETRTKNKRTCYTIIYDCKLHMCMSHPLHQVCVDVTNWIHEFQYNAQGHSKRNRNFESLLIIRQINTVQIAERRDWLWEKKRTMAVNHLWGAARMGMSTYKCEHRETFLWLCIYFINYINDMRLHSTWVAVTTCYW